MSAASVRFGPIRAALVATLLVTCLQAGPAAASSDAEAVATAGAGPATGAPVKLISLDLEVPDSPAFAILGLSPESVVRPASPRDLATTALNGVDRRGNLQSGIAVDFAPLFLFSGKTLTYEDYKKSYGTRLYGRTQISLATAKGAGEGDRSLRLALGLRATLWDDGDPRLDETLVECLDSIVTPPPTTALLTQAARDAYVAKATAERRPAVEGCHRAFKAQRWNASSFTVGIAPSWQSPTGESADFVYAGAAVWASFAFGLTTTTPARNGNPPVVHPFGQVIVQARYRNKEFVPDKNVQGTFFEQDSAGVGARILLGAADRAVVIESEVAHQSPKVGDSTTAFKLSVGGQLKLASNVWISLAVGGTRGGAANEQRGGFVLSTLKWGLSREPAVTLP